MALHVRYGHQNFDDLKETLAAESIDVDKDCRRALRPIPCLGRGIGKGSRGGGRPSTVSISCCIQQGFCRLRGVAIAGFCPARLLDEGDHPGPVRPWGAAHAWDGAAAQSRSFAGKAGEGSRPRFL
uniref:Uncharacterized protein n=1 Tax=Chromera velia CCMP2878 TaxID=1169474 RepID=A0A0G4GVD3_9ALVE|eukprot:Cvel_5260.t1-p1 / transcript=Cvel_5260.t1 / gene=Cvel_5260 / organism=Chromera_velia_CCMP2878 / gene_product=hypothetical protein / transcript_product=hypothetical protein / location=Cvel_scaffold243:1991-3638(+) / protein_length=125 / sequence_SO=supercontig / SO=protein_coding / is_pseudo=false